MLVRALPVPPSRILLGCNRYIKHFRTYSVAASATSEAGAAGSYLTLENEHSSLLEVKKSKFQTVAWPVASAEEALARIEAARDPGASHNCWAFKAGQNYRSSDDGEPSGTAGRPILAAIEGEGLDGVAVLVVRYYGGIKLGAGGLVRAYGGAARECLREAPKRRVLPRVELQLSVPFELLGAVYALIEQHGAQKAGEEYGTEAVELQLCVEAGNAARLQAAVQDATSGRVRPQLAAAAAAGSAS